ncbi:RNA polymerase sigma factor [Novosphingobium aquimarinum]|uniref:RNA polymerase sigma factor n=1 Tax=Novosphingobium aquimarinum TaxID=2682494 RepID=UPI0012EC3904|nr:sigma-70 family RNA polymerase sigma factor [Novosphingobium aquimarinum]
MSGINWQARPAPAVLRLSYKVSPALPRQNAGISGSVSESPLGMTEAARDVVSSSSSLPQWRPHHYRNHMSLGHQDSSASEAGLSQLLNEMRPELSRFMLSRQCDPAEVDDLLQDMYVKLSNAHTGPVKNPRAYLYETANNLLHDHRRGRRRQQARDDHWARNQIGPDLEKDVRPSPEESAIARDELERVNAEIALMPNRTAQILKMYRLEGHSQKAIANCLNLSLSAVEKHLQRAYRKLLLLREELDGVPQLSQEEVDNVSQT